MAFRFGLQRVLDLRARVEQDAARALAGAREAEAAARAEQDALAARRAALAAEADPAQGATVGAMHLMGFLLGRMDEQVTAAAAQAAEAEQTVTARHLALQAAWRDRRTLDLLRERRLDEWKGATAALDRQTMDEIALARFAQHPDGAAARRGTEE
jgi:flagellar export protein FliJ